MLEERSAGAILFNENYGMPDYLLLHYHAGHWDFPKGNIEEGELALDTVRREVKEETSIDNIKFISGFRKKVEYNYKRAGKKVHKEVIYYLAKTSTREVRISFEHKGYGWMNYNDALRHLTYKNSKALLEEANLLLNKLKDRIT